MTCEQHLGAQERGDCILTCFPSAAARLACSFPVLQNERVLFHYNGHGVPRPTANGEIWVFNKSFTQYIPMSIYDLQARPPAALLLGFTPCSFTPCVGPQEAHLMHVLALLCQWTTASNSKGSCDIRPAHTAAAPKSTYHMCLHCCPSRTYGYEYQGSCGAQLAHTCCHERQREKRSCCPAHVHTALPLSIDLSCSLRRVPAFLAAGLGGLARHLRV